MTCYSILIHVQKNGKTFLQDIKGLQWQKENLQEGLAFVRTEAERDFGVQYPGESINVVLDETNVREVSEEEFQRLFRPVV